MNKKDIENFDPQKMLEEYDKWPEMAEEAYKSFSENIEFKKINHIVFAGMGGSGAIGDVFSAILSKTNIHISVVKGYVLPNTVNSETLVITTSVSGNTLETISVLEKANEKNCNLIVFSSGGMMKKICDKKNITHFNVKMSHSPRTSFIIYLYSMLKILNKIINLKKEDVIESINKLKSQRKLINSKNLKNNFAIELAEWIDNIPLIYYPFGLQSTAIRFKNSMQENAKTHAISEDIIEACHNGIVAWEKFSDIKPILIEGKDDFEKTKERWTIIKEFFNTEKIEYKEVFSTNGSILAKIVNLIYFLDYVSIYNAIFKNIDPSPVKSIDYIKKKI
jgi:glucose/mannose-6-phosphate isomerase